jgi:hypothetical protein
MTDETAVDNPPVGAITEIELQKIFGATGTRIFRGLIQEEYRQELRGIPGAKIYDKMRRNDAKVAAILRIVTLPILAATWSVVPGGQEPDDLERRDFIEQNWKRIKPEAFLREAVKYVLYGYYPFEKIFEIENSRVMWKALSPRLPITVWRWSNDAGDFGIEQLVENSVVTQNKTRNLLFIPGEKLMLFSRDREGNNYEGISMFRPAYKAWYFKDRIQQIQAIGIERFLVGIPVISTDKIKQGSSEYDNLLEMAKNIRSNEQSAVVKDNDTEVSILTSSGGDGVKDMAKEAIEFYDKQIAISALAPFLDLGQSGQGSFALSKTQSSFFLMQLKEIAKEMAEVINQGFVELLELNDMSTENPPRIEVSKIDQIDVEQMANALEKLINSDLIEPDRELKRWTRDNFDLPEKQIDEMDDEIDGLSQEVEALISAVEKRMEIEGEMIAKKKKKDQEKKEEEKSSKNNPE